MNAKLLQSGVRTGVFMLVLQSSWNHCSGAGEDEPSTKSSKESKPIKLDYEIEGKYFVCGSFTNAKQATIKKDKDAYIIAGVKAWEKCRFVPQNGHMLEDKSFHIGRIVLGEMQFKDNKKSRRKVLRADFCYDFFVFVDSSIQ